MEKCGAEENQVLPPPPSQELYYKLWEDDPIAAQIPASFNTDLPASPFRFLILFPNPNPQLHRAESVLRHNQPFTEQEGSKAFERVSEQRVKSSDIVQHSSMEH